MLARQGNPITVVAVTLHYEEEALCSLTQLSHRFKYIVLLFLICGAEFTDGLESTKVIGSFVG